MNEQRQRIFLMAARQACLIVDWEGYDDMRLLSKNAVHVLRDHCPAREVACHGASMGSIRREAK